MEHVGKPVHRWLAFSDSWSVPDVAELVAHQNIRPGSIVCDPFVGCGTTAVVCADQGISTVCADISPLAALATRTKLYPPTLARIAALEQRMLGDELDALLQVFASPIATSTPRRRLLESDIYFVIAAALWRSQPTDDSPFDRSRFHTELSLLFQEMSQDIAHKPFPSGTHLVFCSDFRRLLASALVVRGSGPVHVVSSPPFFGSNQNPWQMRLDNCLLAAEPCDAVTTSLVNDLGQLDVHFPLHAVIEDPGLHLAVADYIRFIHALVSFVSALGCSSVALEIGPKRIGDVLLPFDHYLAARLDQAGFHNLQIHIRPHSTELISVITAKNGRQ